MSSGTLMVPKVSSSTFSDNAGSLHDEFSMDDSSNKAVDWVIDRFIARYDREPQIDCFLRR